MKRHPIDIPGFDRRPPHGKRRGFSHYVAATAFLAAWLSFFAFVALYRSPLPGDAFMALGASMADASNVFATV